MKLRFLSNLLPVVVALSIPVLARAVPPEPVVAVTRDSTVSDLSDSLLTDVADSSRATSGLSSITADSSATPPVADWFAPWQPGPVQLDEVDLDWIRPTDFEQAVRWLPGASVRVAGETGMAGFVNTGPLSLAPELRIDGVPSRSPADLDPSIWDRTSTGIAGLSASSRAGASSWGGTEIRASLANPLAGRTVAHTWFTSTANETYTRGLGVRTPGTARLLRLDFQESKTEEGYDYSLAPGVLADPADRGRAKQRHFKIGGEAKTGLGEVSMEFGRGRRFTRGDVLSTDPHERWTGVLALGLDRNSARGQWSARLYHLDFHDDWQNSFNVSRQSSDAARLGLRFERSPVAGGWYGGVESERWSARFVPEDAGVDGQIYRRATVGRAGLGLRTDPARSWSTWASGQIVAADHTASVADLGGRFGVRTHAGSFSFEGFGERVPRVPTLAETSGRFSMQLVTPLAGGGFDYDTSRSTWVWTGAGELDFERLDRAGLRLGAEWGWLSANAGYSHSRLERGIGWEPQGTNIAQVVGGVETSVNVLDGTLRATLRPGRLRWRMLATGHTVLGGMDLASGRPGGWPLGRLLARTGLDHEFFSRHNRIGVDVEVDYMGEHFDDLTGPLGGVVPASTILGGRIWLSIRSAELSIAMENMLDAARPEVLGTWRRGRQIRLGLNWDFFN